MKPRFLQPAAKRWLATGCVLATTACSSWLPPPSLPPALYTLDAAAAAEAAPAAPRRGPTLIVNRPQAAAGFDTPALLYQREPQRLERFAHSEWVDTPARMLAPLIVEALGRSGEVGGGFGAVTGAASAAVGEWRLDTQIVRLQHDFGPLPSRVRFTLRATLLDEATHRVLATREFDETVASASEDARGGVAGAQRAVQAVLKRLAAWCRQLASERPAAAGPAPYALGSRRTTPSDQ